MAVAVEIQDSQTASWMPTDDLGPHAQKGASSQRPPYVVQGMEHHRERQATAAVIDPRFSHAQPSHAQLPPRPAFYAQPFAAQPFPQLPPVPSALTPAVAMRLTRAGAFCFRGGGPELGHPQTPP